MRSAKVSSEPKVMISAAVSPRVRIPLVRKRVPVGSEIDPPALNVMLPAVASSVNEEIVTKSSNVVFAACLISKVSVVTVSAK